MALKIDPDVDEARYALAEDLIYSQQLAKGGYVKGDSAASRSKPKHNLKGDPYFTDGFRLVLVLDRRPRSFLEIESFNREYPVSSRLKRLAVDARGDLDADASPEKLKEIVKLGPTDSPGFDTNTRPVPVSGQLEN